MNESASLEAHPSRDDSVSGMALGVVRSNGHDVPQEQTLLSIGQCPLQDKGYNCLICTNSWNHGEFGSNWIGSIGVTLHCLSNSKGSHETHLSFFNVQEIFQFMRFHWKYLIKQETMDMEEYEPEYWITLIEKCLQQNAEKVFKYALGGWSLMDLSFVCNGEINGNNPTNKTMDEEHSIAQVRPAKDEARRQIHQLKHELEIALESSPSTNEIQSSDHSSKNEKERKKRKSDAVPLLASPDVEIKLSKSEKELQELLLQASLDRGNVAERVKRRALVRVKPNEPQIDIHVPKRKANKPKKRSKPEESSSCDGLSDDNLPLANYLSQSPQVAKAESSTDESQPQSVQTNGTITSEPPQAPQAPQAPKKKPKKARAIEQETPEQELHDAELQSQATKESESTSIEDHPKQEQPKAVKKKRNPSAERKLTLMEEANKFLNMKGQSSRISRGRQTHASLFAGSTTPEEEIARAIQISEIMAQEAEAHEHFRLEVARENALEAAKAALRAERQKNPPKSSSRIVDDELKAGCTLCIVEKKAFLAQLRLRAKEDAKAIALQQAKERSKKEERKEFKTKGRTNKRKPL